MRICFIRKLSLLLALASIGPALSLWAESDTHLPDAPLPIAASAAGESAPHGGVRHKAGHIVVPRLEVTPKFEDFLGTTLAGGAQQMLRVDEFVQRYPKDGDAPKEKTTAFLGYTHDYLYVAFVCNDRHPEMIRGHMLARDILSDDDNVQVMLDTFHDERRAFVFISNPLGIQADAMYSEQTGYDFSFDTVWDTWGRRTAAGYVVLIRIPFASLYFAKTNPGEMRTWGIILQRNISHESESDFWPRSNHDIAGRLTQDMEIEGFSDIEHGQNIQIEPYALARSLRQLNTVNPIDPFFEHKHLQGYTGIDAKFILHNSLVLDTTINPDFSQVGIDNPALPNQRFPPFFAEVRPFFIENSSYFMTPINLYYTNNIVTPQYGARLTGKLGRWAVGLLGVDDRSPGQSVVPGDPGYGTRAQFWVGRLNRDFGALSNVGLIYADREYGDSFNRAGGIDYRIRLRNRWTITGQGVTSQTHNLSSSTTGEQGCETTALSCSGQAWMQQVSYSDLHWNWWMAYNDTSAGFVTDTGFFQRPDIREPNGRLGYIFRPAKGFILSDGPSVYMERIWDHTGTPLDYYLNSSYSIAFRRSTYFSAFLNLGQDRLRPIDYSALPADVEWHSHTEGFNFNSAPVPYFALNASYSQGEVVNYSPPANNGPAPVNMSSPSVNVELKPFARLDMQNNYTFTRFTSVDAGEDVYISHQLISRWNYQLTRDWSFNIIGQYLSTLPHANLTSVTNSKTLFADVLLSYMPHPGTAVYLGYIGNFANIDRALCTRLTDGNCNTQDPILPPTGSSLMNDGKNIYLKVSYLFRF